MSNRQMAMHGSRVGDHPNQKGYLGTGLPGFCQNVPGAAGAAAGAAAAAAAGAAPGAAAGSDATTM